MSLQCFSQISPHTYHGVGSTHPASVAPPTVSRSVSAAIVGKASTGNLKQTWTTRGLAFDLGDAEKFAGTYLLAKATQVKNVWIPYGA